jgi:hypothetical protein
MACLFCDGFLLVGGGCVISLLYDEVELTPIYMINGQRG